ncbi:coiled-coil domain-containing protein [Wolbachia endosymbiont (group B) of Ochlodes sylvanus]|uniref:coiled-coil domain-containing protein n=1 Tax=Wolbachia endosymbiont (group B) of Ochlodes sylvanus TaxID=2954035 RepID=UPI00221EB24C|nr:hypothetical protein [Wolbachia endosymbiont (group B) of Ochlodes sylvanus]
MTHFFERSHLEKKERNKLLRNWSLGGAGLGGVGGACAFFFLAPPIAAFVFAGVAVGSIAVGLLASGVHILINKQGDLEISRDNLQDLNKAIDLFIDLLKQSVPSGISNTFLEELRQEKEEISKSKEKFINLSRISDIMKRVCKKIPGVGKLISEIKEKKWKDIELIMLLLEDFEREFNKAVAESSKVKEVTFVDLAMNIIRSRENYIRCLKTQSMEDEQNDTTKKLSAVADEISDMLIDLSNAEVKRMAHKEKKTEVRAEMAEARVKALDLVYIKAYEFKIPMKKIIQNQDIRELLTQQYAFLVLNTDYAEKFKGICNEYRNLKEELKSKQLRLNNEQEKYVFDKEEKKHVMGKLAKLNDEIDRLSKNFVQREHKENESAEEFDDEAINELRFHVIAETKQARKATEQERKALIEEKNAVEEIVMQLQRSDSVQTPSSAFSSVSHESVAGPSWRI